MELRFINLKDEDYAYQLEIRNWRNSIHVAQYFQIDNIDLQTHKNWLNSLKEESPKNIAFLIKYSEDYIGLVYFTKIDYILKICDWGMYIFSLNRRGLGIGGKVLDWSLDYLKKNNFDKVNLEVLNTNINAIKLYKKKGFQYIENKNKKVQKYQMIL